jgi:hypothetical protein
VIPVVCELPRSAVVDGDLESVAVISRAVASRRITRTEGRLAVLICPEDVAGGCDKHSCYHNDGRCLPSNLSQFSPVDIVPTSSH